MQEVIDVLKQHKILGLPVIGSQQKIIDVITWYDICARALAMSGDNIEQTKPAKFGNLFSSKFYEMKVKDVLGNRTFSPLTRKATLLDVLHVLEVPGNYRAVVVSKYYKKINRFITQFDVIHYIHDNIKDFDSSITSQTIAETGLGIGSVLCVNDNTQVFDAFYKIITYHVQGLGVLDHHDGTLVGAVSVRDLRRVLTEDVEDNMTGTVADLIKKVRAENAKYATPLEAITCTVSNDIHYVVWKLQTARVHRVFIVDDKRRPVGVITSTDIFRYLLHPRRFNKDPSTDVNGTVQKI
jgi:CBS-domain-containing membrane protein